MSFIGSLIIVSIAYGLGYIRGVYKAKKLLSDARAMLESAKVVTLEGQELLQMAKKIAEGKTTTHE